MRLKGRSRPQIQALMAKQTGSFGLHLPKDDAHSCFAPARASRERWGIIAVLWIDTTDSDTETRVVNTQDLRIRNALRELKDVGFAILSRLISDHDCDLVNSDFERFCAENPEHSREFTLASGNHSRLYNLHQESQITRKVALNPVIMSLLDTLFTGRAALNSTLYFEESSEQQIHRDTPFFTAEPFRGEFVGVWFALEDVQPDAGPLVYLPAGHRLNFDMEEVKRDAAHVGEMFRRYCTQIETDARARGIEVRQAILKKGDVAIWHPELPHGGSAIRRPGKTRRSLVAHYMPEGAYIQAVGYFFGLEEQKKIMEFQDAGVDNRLMRWNERPIFMPNA